MPACTVPLTATAAEVAQALVASRSKAAGVVDSDGRLVGLVSVRDIIKRVVYPGKRVAECQVSEFGTMHPRTMTLAEARDRTAALTLMAQHGFRHVPVVNDDGSLSHMLDVLSVTQEVMGGLGSDDEEETVCAQPLSNSAPRSPAHAPASPPPAQDIGEAFAAKLAELQSKVSSFFSLFSPAGTAAAIPEVAADAEQHTAHGSASDGASPITAAIASRASMRLHSGWSGEYEPLLPATATLYAAQAFLVERNVSVACVAGVNNDAELGGVLTEGDIVKAIARLGDGDEFLQRSALAHMTPASMVSTIPTHTSVGSALHLMLRGNFRHLPMLDEDSGRVMMTVNVLHLSRQLLGVAIALPVAGADSDDIEVESVWVEEEEEGLASAPFASPSRLMSPGPHSAPEAPTPGPATPAPFTPAAPPAASVSHTSATGLTAMDVTLAPAFHRRLSSTLALHAAANGHRAAAAHSAVVATERKVLRNLARLQAAAERAADGAAADANAALACLALVSTRVRALQLMGHAWKMLGVTGDDGAVAAAGVPGVSSAADALSRARDCTGDALEALQVYNDWRQRAVHAGAGVTPGDTLTLVCAEDGGGGSPAHPAAAGTSTITAEGGGLRVTLIAEHVDVFLRLMRAELCVFTGDYANVTALVLAALPVVESQLPTHATRTAAVSRGHARQYIGSILTDLVAEAGDACELASEAVAGSAVAVPSVACQHLAPPTGAMNPMAPHFQAPAAASLAQRAVASVRAAHAIAHQCEWLQEGPIAARAAALRAPDVALEQAAWAALRAWAERQTSSGVADALADACALAGEALPAWSGAQQPCCFTAWRFMHHAAALRGSCPRALAGSACAAAALSQAASGSPAVAAAWRARALVSAGGALHAAAMAAGGLHGAAQGDTREAAAWTGPLERLTLALVEASAAGLTGETQERAPLAASAVENTPGASPAKTGAQSELDELAALLAAHGDA